MELELVPMRSLRAQAWTARPHMEGAHAPVRSGRHAEIADFESAGRIARLERSLGKICDAQKAVRVGEAGDICFNGDLRR